MKPPILRPVPETDRLHEPATLALLAAYAASGAASGAASSIGARNAAKRQQQLTREQIAAQERADQQSTALDESKLDPFRHQMSQAQDISHLDQLERASYMPTTIAPAGPYAAYVPKMSGGFSYSKSPELIASAGAAKRNVMGGNVAPTMTDPSNYGKTAALDLVSMQKNGVDPATVSAATTAPRTTAAYAGPETAGANGNGDVDVQTASAIVTKAILQETGRPATPQQVQAILAGQGLKPGDRWVGRAGLTSVLAAIRNTAGGNMQPSYTARG